MKIEYVGKTLLVEHENERILVVGDLHLGFEESLRSSGVMLPLNIFGELLADFDKVFEKVGKVDKVILLGDVKHEFGRINYGERKEFGELFSYLKNKTKEFIVIKGNHDAIIEFLVKDFEGVDLVDYLILEDVVFLHGDKDFPEIHEKKIKKWVVAHGHPAITLYENHGSKKEKYKCFLIGKYKGKEVTVMPSFFDVNLGTDPKEFDIGFAWDLNLNDFSVKVVQDDRLEVLDFGILKNLE